MLGVEATATDSEIKKAFRVKSKSLHPDLYKGNDKAAADFEFNQVRHFFRCAFMSIVHTYMSTILDITCLYG
jgi:hypothetical protein